MSSFILNTNYITWYISFFMIIFLISRDCFKLGEKLSKLYPTMIHAGICVILTFYYLFSYNYELVSLIRKWSVSYFIYDTYWHIKKWNLLYILHHIASIIVFIYFLPYKTEDYDGNLMIFCIFICELGNFSVYRVNYKIYKNYYVTNIDLFGEIFCFVVIRNLFGILMMFIVQNNIYRLCIFCFWFVSVWWGYGIIKQFYKKIYTEISIN